jgi:hypothetical protein
VPASRPRTPAWLAPRLTPDSPIERVGALTAPLRLGALLDDERLGRLYEPLRLALLLDDERFELLYELLRLGLLYDDERLEPLYELLRLEPLNELPLDDERLLLIELLCPPPPLRLPPPPRCASAGVALRARAIMTRVIAFEVFISLLLSF